jgi:hypothetical protein
LIPLVGRLSLLLDEAEPGRFSELLDHGGVEAGATVDLSLDAFCLQRGTDVLTYPPPPAPPSRCPYLHD